MNIQYPKEDTVDIPSNAQTGPILSHPTTQAQLSTPRSPGYGTARPWREQPPYGMPTSLMAGSHNNTWIDTQPAMTTFSPIQGFGSGMNNIWQNTQSQGFSTQFPILTMNKQAVFRQKMEDSNHKMIGVLSQQMNRIFSSLIQNDTHNRFHWWPWSTYST